MYTFSPNTAIESSKVNSNFAEVAASAAATPPTGSVIPYISSSAPTGWLNCDGSAVSRSTYAALFALTGTTYGAGNGSTTFNLPDLRSRVPLGTGAGTFATSFAPSDVDTGTEIITVPTNAALITTTPIIFTTTGSLPTGIALATTYYVIRISATTIKVATSAANAKAGTAVNITAQGSGVHTLTATYTNFALGTKGGEENHNLTTDEMPNHSHIMPASMRRGGAGSSGFGYVANISNTADIPYESVDAIGGGGSHNIMQPFLALNYIIKV